MIKCCRLILCQSTFQLNKTTSAVQRLVWFILLDLHEISLWNRGKRCKYSNERICLLIIPLIIHPTFSNLFISAQNLWEDVSKGLGLMAFFLFACGKRFEAHVFWLLSSPLVQWRSLLRNIQGGEAPKKEASGGDGLWPAGAAAVGGPPVFGCQTLHTSLVLKHTWNPYISCRDTWRRREWVKLKVHQQHPLLRENLVLFEKIWA